MIRSISEDTAEVIQVKLQLQKEGKNLEWRERRDAWEGDEKGDKLEKN